MMKTCTLTLAALCAVAVSAGTATAGSRPPRPNALTDRQSAELARLFDGKTAGAPVACVQMGFSTDGPRAITDDVLVYQAGRDLIYRNDLSGSCNGISRGNVLLLKPTNSQYCRGDIARALDSTTGMTVGSCALGSFVPYRATPKG